MVRYITFFKLRLITFLEQYLFPCRVYLRVTFKSYWKVTVSQVTSICWFWSQLGFLWPSTSFPVIFPYCQSKVRVPCILRSVPRSIAYVQQSRTSSLFPHNKKKYLFFSRPTTIASRAFQPQCDWIQYWEVVSLTVTKTYVVGLLT